MRRSSVAHRPKHGNLKNTELHRKCGTVSSVSCLQMKVPHMVGDMFRIILLIHDRLHSTWYSIGEAKHFIMGSAAVTLIIALLTFVISADSLETDPQCPNPSEVLTFYPYPYDCAQYYECYEGNRYLITCPTDLYWNTITGRCDNKTSVDCGTRGSSTVNPATTATTSTGSTASPGTQTVAPTTGAPDPLCPYPSDVLTFYENPSDCSQYYECYEGKKYLITC
ncbi:hypothetical protein NQ317_007997, partial [Molorchus minor]